MSNTQNDLDVFCMFFVIKKMTNDMGKHFVAPVMTVECLF